MTRSPTHWSTASADSRDSPDSRSTPRTGPAVAGTGRTAAEGAWPRQSGRSGLVGALFFCLAPGSASAGTAGALARRVAALQHGQPCRGGQPMAGRVVEEALLRQAGEAVDRARRLGVVELQPEVALVGRHAGADLPRVGRDLAGARRVGWL